MTVQAEETGKKDNLKKGEQRHSNPEILPAHAPTSVSHCVSFSFFLFFFFLHRSQLMFPLSSTASPWAMCMIAFLAVCYLPSFFYLL